MGALFPTFHRVRSRMKEGAMILNYVDIGSIPSYVQARSNKTRRQELKKTKKRMTKKVQELATTGRRQFANKIRSSKYQGILRRILFIPCTQLMMY